MNAKHPKAASEMHNLHGQRNPTGDAPALRPSAEKPVRSPEDAIGELEKIDAYDANDMQPPFDEAPVKAGGARLPEEVLTD